MWSGETIPGIAHQVDANSLLSGLSGHGGLVSLYQILQFGVQDRKYIGTVE
jgi:hypothetical protein